MPRAAAIGYVLAAALAVGCGRPPNAEPPGSPREAADAQEAKRTADLEWARVVAEEFLPAAGRDLWSGEALAWASDAYRERLTKGPGGVDTFPFAEWSIDAEALSPAGDEAVFRGSVVATLRGRYTRGASGVSGGGYEFHGRVPFTLLVIREPTSGRWRVRTLQDGQPLANDKG